MLELFMNVTQPEVMDGVPLDIKADLIFCLASFVAIFVLDRLCVAIGFFPEPKSATRYFALHVVVNAFVVAIHLPDVIATYDDPSNSFDAPCETRGLMAIVALHLYHIVFFRPLDMVDWVHHIVMVVWMSPLAYALAPGHLLGHGCFYVSGLPGGLDYLLLVLIKTGHVTKMQEKKWNSTIQLWIRAPGCLLHAYLTYHCAIIARERILDPTIPDRNPTTTYPMIPYAYAGISCWVVIVTFFWNGQYFLERVIRSHERNIIFKTKKAN
eukprot:m.123068 g.123068  ORF g.123068 m.123068 type:complete len:268 (-) comp13742_c3_seq1:572-1375(-)